MSDTTETIKINNMTNQEYWADFYSKNIAPKTESSFAHFVLNRLNASRLENISLIDVACGNGRDTFFFAKNSIQSTGIDLAFVPKNEKINFIQENILTFDYSEFDVIHLRFIVHALKEIEFDQLLQNLKKTKKSAKIFIETRSTQGVTDESKSETYFKSSIGEEHFRMLYSKDYLRYKLEEHFDIEYLVEDQGLSIYKEEDPVCLRFVLSHKE